MKIKLQICHKAIYTMASSVDQNMLQKILNTKNTERLLMLSKNFAGSLWSICLLQIHKRK